MVGARSFATSNAGQRGSSHIPGDANRIMRVLIVGAKTDQTLPFCCCSIRSDSHAPPLPNNNGSYFHNKRRWVKLPPDDKASDSEAAKALFDKCNTICGI